MNKNSDNSKTSPQKAAPKPPQGDQSVKKAKEEVKLCGLYGFKEAMSSLYDEKGRRLAVTFVRVPSWYVSQIKTQEREGYTAVQVASGEQKNKRCSKALLRHLKPAGFKEGAAYIKEIRQKSLKDLKVGLKLSIHSLKKGDVIKVRSFSKGHGFSGVVKRWGFSGGPASHGSKIHRMGGSVGNRTEPARVMPGKKMPGHFGFEKTTIRKVKVVDVLPENQMVILKGPVPGAKNSLVFMSSST